MLDDVIISVYGEEFFRACLSQGKLKPAKSLPSLAPESSIQLLSFKARVLCRSFLAVTTPAAEIKSHVAGRFQHNEPCKRVRRLITSLLVPAALHKPGHLPGSPVSKHSPAPAAP